MSENILLPFELAGRRPAQGSAWIDHLVHTLGLADRVGHRPTSCPAGSSSASAIARALATPPDVIFADEPTGNLDSRSSREVLDVAAPRRPRVRPERSPWSATTRWPRPTRTASSVIADGRLVADHGALAPQQISDLLIGFEVGAA